MAHYSEYNTKPRVILVNNPRHNKALRHITTSNIAMHNFTEATNWQVLCDEFDNFVKAVDSFGVKVADVSAYVARSDAEILNNNPNSIFTRDPVITLPWQPDVAVQSQMTLAGRADEPEIIATAIRALGVTNIYVPPKHISFEGGDFCAVVQNGQRTLYIGIGSRTSKQAAAWVAETLYADNHIDNVICLRHNKKLLHLDTCFTLLPNNVAVLASHAISDGFSMDKSRRTKDIRPVDYLESNGFKIVHTSADAAALDEVCNMLYVGSNTFISFNMSNELVEDIQETANVKIKRLHSREIVKANGGVHCLSRQLY